VSLYRWHLPQAGLCRLDNLCSIGIDGGPGTRRLVRCGHSSRPVERATSPTSNSSFAFCLLRLGDLLLRSLGFFTLANLDLLGHMLVRRVFFTTLSRRRPSVKKRCPQAPAAAIWGGWSSGRSPAQGPPPAGRDSSWPTLIAWLLADPLASSTAGRSPPCRLDAK